MKQKLWNIIAALIWLVQLGAEAAAVWAVHRLHMLPDLYFTCLIAVLLLASALTGVLLFLRAKEPGKKSTYVRRGIAVLLAAAAVAGCAVAASAAAKLNRTMQEITQPSVVRAVIGVYVLDGDPAQTLPDAGDYVFAVTDSYDADNTRQAVASIEEELGREIATETYETVFAMIDALYDGKADALILNEAYAGILEDIELYADFEDETRILHEVVISEQVEVTEPPVQEAEDAAVTENTAPAEGPEEEVATPAPFVLYLSGSDTRSKMLATSRSDVNILMVVNPETKQVLLVNTPRDYYVPNPAGGGALDKLTHCGVYGIQCSIDALAGLYDVEIDYYAQINFTGFETLIDAIGGVTVYSEEAFTAHTGNYEFQAGENRLNGSQALAFARERYAFATGDNQRGKNQMKIITAVIEEMSAGTILKNYSGILESLQGMFITDMTTDGISQLVKMQLSDMAKWNVKSYAVTGYNGSEITFSMPGLYAYVMYPNESTVAHASDLIGRVLAGETLTEEDVNPAESF